MLTVDLIEDVSSPVSAAEFEAALEPILKYRKLSSATIELLMTDDATMQTLNRQHRGIDKTTDVLSLPTAYDNSRDGLIPTSDQPVHLGTIVISLSEAIRRLEAGDVIPESTGNDLRSELLGLAAHGLRHLLGQDHDDEGAWLTP